MPSKQEQITQTHAELIVNVVAVVQNPELASRLEHPLRVSADNGWTELVARIRRIIAGERNADLLIGLDEEDATIVSAILNGIQNPASLPNPMDRANASMAAPGLAQMVHAASRGDSQALLILGNMAEQMRQTGGPMARIGAVLGRLVNGERDANRLADGMDGSAQRLLLSILDELSRLDLH